jgi:hypothetical protein
MSGILAIPGQSTRWLHPPAGAVDSAVAAVRQLNARFWAADPFALLFDQPGYVAGWDAQRGELHVTCAPKLTRRQYLSQSVTWRWGTLWTAADGWYEPGWHPDAKFHALRPRIAAELWDVLNPGRRYRPGTRNA